MRPSQSLLPAIGITASADALAVNTTTLRDRRLTVRDRIRVYPTTEVVGAECAESRGDKRGASKRRSSRSGCRSHGPAKGRRCSSKESPVRRYLKSSRREPVSKASVADDFDREGLGTWQDVGKVLITAIGSCTGQPPSSD